MRLHTAGPYLLGCLGGAAIAGLIAIALLKSEFVLDALGIGSRGRMDYFIASMTVHTLRINRSIQPGDVIFLGDSHVQGLNVAAITPRGVNLGIGGDTIDQLRKRLPALTSLATAGAVVLEIGFNDLTQRGVDETSQRMTLLVEDINAPLVLSAVPPSSRVANRSLPPDINDRIRAFNAHSRELCEKRMCVFVGQDVFAVDAAGNSIVHEGDGVHLSAEGYRAWHGALRGALQSLTQAAPT